MITETLGATIEGLNLSQPLPPGTFDEVVQALGRHSVIRFPDQQFAVVCMCNTFTNTQNITRAIAALYLGDQMKDETPAGSRALTRPEIIDLKGAARDATSISRRSFG